MAGAFQRAVAGTQPQLRTDTPAEDWYVGVGGVPIGPVRLSVIREKVEQRAVDGESLVWREGFDEWQPLKNVPGLRAILDEGRRGTAPPPEAGHRPSISSTSLPRASAPTPPPGQLVTPLGPVGATPNGSSLASGNLASSNGAAANGALGHGLGAAPLSSLSGTDGVSLGPAASPGGAAALQAGNPFALPAPSPQAPASFPPPSRAEERKGLNPFAYAMIAMAAVFGGVAAFVLLTREPTQLIVVQTAAPEVGLAAAPPPPPTGDGESPPEPATSATAKPGETRVAGGGTRPAAPAESGKGEVVPPPNAGSFDTPGVGGPTAGPGKDGAGSAKGQLSEGEISAVVNRNQPGVRRRCWQPALDARSASAPKAARVSTTITIGPSGAVSSANASGSEQHYPGLSACIGSAIRGWQFPPSDGTTTVNVPFSFVSQ